jgi:P-type E1-E2 ATPase
MLEFNIPGYKKIRLEHLVLDYNGTLACDGKLLPGVRERLKKLSAQLKVHVLTADTFGKARSQLSGIPCVLSVLPVENQGLEKLEYIKKIGTNITVCIGNGRNDQLMIKEAELGISVVLKEGAAIKTLIAADVICNSIISALDLLTNPLRLEATLRS